MKCLCYNSQVSGQIQTDYTNMNKQLQYQFDLDVHRVYLIIPFQCIVQIWWRKGRNKIITQKSIDIRGGETYFDVSEPLSIGGICHLRNGSFQPKISGIQIVLVLPDKTIKHGGTLSLDMTSILDTNKLQHPISRRFEKQLQTCPCPKSKITYTFSAHFLRQCSNNSMTDISFQDINSIRRERNSAEKQYKGSDSVHSQDNVSTTSRGGINYRTATDMTFRTSQYDSQKQPEHRMPPRPENRPNQYRGDYRSPPTPNLSAPIIPGVRPLQFSFNPVNNVERQKERKEMMEQMAQLNRQLQERKKEVQRMKSQNGQSNSQRSLQMMNELNSTTIAMQQLKKQRADLMGQLSRSRQEAMMAVDRLKGQFNQQRKDLLSKIQQRRKAIDECNVKMSSMSKQIEELKKQVFKKQSQMLAYQDRMESIKNDMGQMERFRNEQAVRKNEREWQERCKKLQIQIEKERDLGRNKEKEWQERYKKIEGEREKERAVVRKREQQQEAILGEIEKEMNAMRGSKEEVLILRQKLSSACRKIDQFTNKQNSAVSGPEDKQKQKVFEETVARLQAEIISRDKVIEQAKIYVKDKQVEVEQRDQFISRAKEYIQAKESEFQIERKAWRQKEAESKAGSKVESKAGSKVENKAENKVENKADTTQNSQFAQRLEQQNMKLRNELREKEKYLQEYLEAINSKHERISDLQNYIDTMQEKLSINQDQFQELVRKTRSQQETLEDLVKKNLDMEIQLNVKNFELDSLKRIHH